MGWFTLNSGRQGIVLCTWHHPASFADDGSGYPARYYSRTGCSSSTNGRRQRCMLDCSSHITISEIGHRGCRLMEYRTSAERKSFRRSSQWLDLPSETAIIITGAPHLSGQSHIINNFPNGNKFEFIWNGRISKCKKSGRSKKEIWKSRVFLVTVI